MGSWGDNPIPGAFCLFVGEAMNVEVGHRFVSRWRLPAHATRELTGEKRRKRHANERNKRATKMV